MNTAYPKVKNHLVQQAQDWWETSTPLSWVGSHKAADKRAGRLHYEKRERYLHFTHTVRQAWWCRATLHLSHPWGCALGQPTRQASALVCEGAPHKGQMVICQGHCRLHKPRINNSKQHICTAELL